MQWDCDNVTPSPFGGGVNVAVITVARSTAVVILGLAWCASWWESRIWASRPPRTPVATDVFTCVELVAGWNPDRCPARPIGSLHDVQTPLLGEDVQQQQTAQVGFRQWRR